MEDLGNDHNQIAQGRNMICSQLYPCFRGRQAALNAAEWGNGDLNIPSYKWHLLSWSFVFFPAKTMNKCCCTPVRVQAPFFMQCYCQCWCSDSGITWAVGEEGFVWQKQGCEWVSACQAVLRDCSWCGDGTSYQLARTTPALAQTGVQDSGCATASSGMSPQAGNMPGLHSTSGTV